MNDKFCTIFSETGVNGIFFLLTYLIIVTLWILFNIFLYKTDTRIGVIFSIGVIIVYITHTVNEFKCNHFFHGLIPAAIPIILIMLFIKLTKEDENKSHKTVSEPQEDLSTLQQLADILNEPDIIISNNTSKKSNENIQQDEIEELIEKILVVLGKSGKQSGNNFSYDYKEKLKKFVNISKIAGIIIIIVVIITEVWEEIEGDISKLETDQVLSKFFEMLSSLEEYEVIEMIDNLPNEKARVVYECVDEIVDMSDE